MNGRQKKLYRSYGLSTIESEEAIAKIRKEHEKSAKDLKPVHCSYMDYKIVNKKQQIILELAKHFNLVGKHAGSKPLHKLEKVVRSMENKINKYSRMYKALQEAQKENEAPQEEIIEENTNVD